MSVTDDYLRHRAAYFGKEAVVLDFGCGDARFVEMMLDAGIDAFGIDVPAARESVEARAAKRPDLNIRSRVAYLEDPERINIPDKSVDIVVSNTVFEHIQTLGSTVSELARILRPSGRVYTVFPLRSAIWEQHANLPLIHRIDSRRARLWYLKAAKSLGFYHGVASPEAMENYVSRNCFYRDESEIRVLFAKKFASVESDVHTYIEFKARALANRDDIVRRNIGRLLANRASAVARFVHFRHSAAYCLSNPRH